MPSILGESEALLDTHLYGVLVQSRFAGKNELQPVRGIRILAQLSETVSRSLNSIGYM